MALIGLISFSLNAATIKVAAGASIGAAITSAAAKDTISVAAGIFNEHILIDKQLTLIGAHHDSTIIKRAATDSITVATIKITGKKVVVKNMGIFGHDAYRWGADSLLKNSYPTTDAVLLSNADSVSILSCDLVAGNGTDWRSMASASGGIGLNVYKSKWTHLQNDSIVGGFDNRTGIIGIDTVPGETPDGRDTLVFNPLFETGLPGAGINIDSSSFLSASHIFVMGGDGKGMNYKGFGQEAANGVFCVTAENISIDTSTLYGGQEFLMVWDTSMHAVQATIGSSVKLTDCTYALEGFRIKKVDATSTVIVNSTGVLSNSNRSWEKNAFTIRFSGGQSPSVVFGCVLTKASFVGIDLLNAKGQAVKRLRTERAQPGSYSFPINLTKSGISLANTAYFLRITTNENSRSFRLPSVR